MINLNNLVGMFFQADDGFGLGFLIAVIVVVVGGIYLLTTKLRVSSTSTNSISPESDDKGRSGRGYSESHVDSVAGAAAAIIDANSDRGIFGARESIRQRERRNPNRTVSSNMARPQRRFEDNNDGNADTLAEDALYAGVALSGLDQIQNEYPDVDNQPVEDQTANNGLEFQDPNAPTENMGAGAGGGWVPNQSPTKVETSSYEPSAPEPSTPEPSYDPPTPSYESTPSYEPSTPSVSDYSPSSDSSSSVDTSSSGGSDW